MKAAIAHSANDTGREQPLVEHCQNVADLAINFTNPLLQVYAKYAGIFHDIGKLHPEFQEKLKNSSNKRVDHKGLGVGLAKKYCSKILQFVVAGHHGGLKNPEDIDIWFKEIHNKGEINKIATYAREFLKQFCLPDESYNKIERALPIQEDLATRMIFSALVDADFLDTELHFNPENQKIRESENLTQNHWDSFQQFHKSLTQGKTGELNQLRKDVYKCCIQKAENKPGFFRLTVPTGGGKTLSSLGFALKHTLANQQDRIIYAIPFTSIIEQTAGEFKKIFPSGTILEHHTGIHVREPNEIEEDKDWNRLASENWDAPIVVTTTVQLFESLMARSTSKCRKLHNIQNSVIILDEVQTLPLPLLPTIMSVLKDLVSYFNVTVVFCSATQPALNEFLTKDDIEPIELAPNPENLFSKLERVHYYNFSNEKWDWEKIEEEIQSSERVMAVMNTKKDAHELWIALADKSAYHLSATMCGAHRRKVLDEIREKLKNKEECKLISTQVVEAGVDVDFDKVLRAIGPLDRIVQAAGRCNREGKLRKGDVVIFNPLYGSFPKGVYGSALHSASQLLNNPEIKLDMNKPETFPNYFSKLYQNIQFDPNGVEQNRMKLKFDHVARDFKMIDDDSVSVIVNYEPEKVQKLLDKLKNVPQTAKETIRKLQPYMVSLPRWDFKKNQTLVQEVFPNLFFWTGRYDDKLGLLKEIDLKHNVL